MAAAAQLTNVMKMLADPTRRAMVERLSRGPITLGELAQPFAMSLPAVMQHLAVLETSGLVVSQKSGRVRTCRINPAAFAEAERFFSYRRDGQCGRMAALIWMEPTAR